MAIEATADQYVSANGIDIHYVEAGQGEPLVLLHQGMVSTNPLWADSPVAYAGHMDAFAERFRVIAPDLRGCGRTVNPGGGSISYAVLVDDALALIDALGLDQPLVCGFSDGATVATILGIRSPGSVRAIVNHAGYDLINPQAPSFTMARQVLGGSPDAAEADPAAAERFFDSLDEMRPLLAGMRAEHGDGWTTILMQIYDRITRSPGYTFEDLRAITAPTLILAGDRDGFCSVEEGVEAYRLLAEGELAILPGCGHVITPAAVELTLDFLRRHAVR
jgi:pimeloyl-ACP methyl ester carboxylesterase